MSLTQTTIDRAKVKDRDYRLTDKGGSGLSVRVYKSGAKTYFFRHLTSEGAHRDHRIGNANILKLKDARRRALELQSELEHGREIDPTIAARASDLTVSEVLELYERSFNFSEYSEKTKRWHLSVYKKHLHPKMGDRNFAKLTRADWIRFMRTLITTKGGAGTARSVKNIVQTIYSWAEDEELAVNNVLRGKKHIKPQIPRDRVLDDEEIRNLWLLMKSGAHGTAVSCCTLVVLLTAQRIGETTAMLVEDIDVSKKIWRIPQHITKNRRQHEVPLSDLCLSVLEVAVGARTSGKVFEIHEKSVTNALVRYQNDQRFRGKFTAHDLRRTFATKIHRVVNRAEPDLVRRILNHSTKATGALAHYDHYDYAEQKRELLDAWSHYIELLVNNARCKEDDHA